MTAIIGKMQVDGLESQKAWTITDYSKLDDFMTCPRKYFFRHITGWVYEGTNIHLVFGEAWHRAMEALLQNGVSESSIPAAIDAFDGYYRQHYTEESDTENMPKSPLIVPEALVMFVASNTHHDFELISTELSGQVEVGAHRLMHYRIDALLRGKHGIVIWDYKTTGALTKVWREQFALSLQFGTYLHAAHIMYPDEKVDGLTVKGLIARKSGCAIEDVPISKTADSMIVYLYTVNDWISRLEDQWIKLSQASKDDAYLMAFPMNPAGCTKYNTLCPYHAFCMAWPNPLARCAEVPIGMKQEYWDPSERE